MERAIPDLPAPPSCRIHPERKRALMAVAIDREYANRHGAVIHGPVRRSPQQQMDETHRRYAIWLDFHYGTSAEETRAMQARLESILFAGRIPALAEVRGEGA